MKTPKDTNRLEQIIKTMMYIYYQIDHGDEEMAKAFNDYLDELDARSNNPCNSCQNREN